MKFQNKRFRDLYSYIILDIINRLFFISYICIVYYFSTKGNLLEDLENHFETEPEKVLEAIKYQEFDLVSLMISIMSCAIIYIFDSYLVWRMQLMINHDYIRNQCCVCSKLSIFVYRKLLKLIFDHLLNLCSRIVIHKGYLKSKGWCKMFV